MPEKRITTLEELKAALAGPNPPKKLYPEEAAKIMDKTPQYIRCGLQHKLLPFGTAVPMGKKWSYGIPPLRFLAYMEGRLDREEVVTDAG